MAKNLQSSNRKCPLNFRRFICIALVCLLNIHCVGMYTQESGIKCGTIAFLPHLITTRILKGTATRPGDWPFIAALYYNNGSNYMCGGTIISDRHILTAAHCIQSKGAEKQRDKGDIKVRLGAHNLTVKDEGSVVQRNVTEIHVHPDWNAYGDDYDADVAILELSENIVFTDYIRPICLPTDDAFVDGVYINVTGLIVGWGLDQNENHEEVPKEAAIQTLNDSYCYRNNIGVVVLSSARTFCGIGVGSPNSGDSGGGFFVDIDFVYRQYGIISSIRANYDGRVGSNLASVYTNVKSFRDWIVTTVAKSGLKVGGIDLRCDYGYIGHDLYTCSLNDLNIRKRNTWVESFTGSHKDGKTDQDVKRIEFRNGTMAFFPNNIGNLFRNLEHLELKAYYSDSLGTKSIRRSFFENMENLKSINVRDEFETIDEDALWDLPNLVFFACRYSKLKQLHEKTFDKNMHLSQVDLSFSKLEFLPRNLFRLHSGPLLLLFNNNKIKIIETDFAEFELTNYFRIVLEGNICIDSTYRDVTEYRNAIKTKCSRADA